MTTRLRNFDCHRISCTVAVVGGLILATSGAATANAQFLLGLGHLGLGHAAEARAAFDEALRQDVSHTWANAMRSATP